MAQRARPGMRGVGAALTIVALVGCAAAPEGEWQPAAPSMARTAPPASTDGQDATAGSALELLETLPVRGRAPRTGYGRDLFGAAWADVDRNGCDTRNDILARDLREETFRPGTRGCVVVTGELADPYTGDTLVFIKADASAVQIDHVVSLSNAWQTGAQQWSAEQRRAFANDPLNLLAVDGSANMAKSDGDAATWLPPHRPFRCELVARQTAVKATYGLWLTSPEKAAIRRVLQSCPGEPAPTGTGATGAAASPQQERTELPPPAAAAPGVDPGYGTCTSARAHGAGPYSRGSDPEYELYRDADGDGTVCE